MRLRRYLLPSRRHLLAPALIALCAGLIALCGTAAALAGGGTPTAARAHASGVPAPAPVRATEAAASRSMLRPHLVHVLPVAPLRALVSPDVLVELGFSATSAQLARVRALPGLQAVAALDAGTVRTPYAQMYAVGVDPSQFRAFTPRITARSDALWQAVARGDMAVSYTYADQLKSRFAQPVTVASGDTQHQLRLGAFASFGIPGADVVLDHEQARWAGLLPDRRLLVAAPRLSLAQISAELHQVLGPRADVKLLRPEAVDQYEMSAFAAEVIPTYYLRLYRAAAQTCPGLPWTVLAAIGAVETGDGTNVATSYAGAEGPMQFLPSTWRYYGIDADGDGVANIMDPVDAVYSAAYYLCAQGAGRGGQSLYDAIYAYNHADWYVREVIALALRYQ